MWKDLSIKEKSQIMNLAVQQGITDLEDIRRAYNDTIDIYDTSSTNTYNNLPQSPSPREVRYDDGGPLGVIVTPDRDYNVFLNSLPDYQKYGTDYNTRRYWELSGKPRDFEEALHMNPPMYNWDKKDHRYHASTVAYNRDNDTYEFMKSPDHPTIDLELLQYWNNPTMADFREKYGLDLYSNPYRYVRRDSTDKKLYAEGGNLFKGGGKKRTLNPQTFANVYDMIKKHEGFYANAYVDGHAKDGTTWYSIGYGTNDSSMHKNLARKYREAGKSISREEAERLMREEVAHVDSTLRRTLGEKAYRALTPGQKMALLDVGYQRPLSMINAATCLRKGDLAGAERNLFVKQAGDQRNLNRRAAFNGRIGPTDAFPDSHLGSGPAPGRANYDNVVKASEIYSRKPRAFNETVTPTINPYNMDMGELAVNQWFNELLNKRRAEEVAPQELTSNEALASIVSSPRRQPTPIEFEVADPVVEAAEQQAIAEKPSVISTIMGIDPYQLANNSDSLLSLGSLTSDYFDTRGLLKNGGRLYSKGGPKYKYRKATPSEEYRASQGLLTFVDQDTGKRYGYFPKGYSIREGEKEKEDNTTYAGKVLDELVVTAPRINPITERDTDENIARRLQLQKDDAVSREFNRQLDNFSSGDWLRPSHIIGAFNPSGKETDATFAERLLLGTDNYGVWNPDSKFYREHPYIAEGINALFDFTIPNVIHETPSMYRNASAAAKRGAINTAARSSFLFPKKNAAAETAQLWRNQEYNNLLSSINGNNYYELAKSTVKHPKVYYPNEEYFLSHTTPWMEFAEPPGLPFSIKTMEDFMKNYTFVDRATYINPYNKLYEFPHETFGDLKATGAMTKGLKKIYDTPVKDLGELHLKYGDYASGSWGEVPVMGDFPNTYRKGWGLIDRPLEKTTAYPNGVYNYSPVYENIFRGPQTIVKGEDLIDALSNSSYNIYERTPYGVQRTLYIGK